MAKLVVKCRPHTSYPPKLSTFTHNSKNNIDVLAEQLRRAILLQCLPRLCAPCRRTLAERTANSSVTASKTTTLASCLCFKCSRVMLSFIQENGKHDNGAITDSAPPNSIANRLFSFVSSVYSGLCTSSDSSSEIVSEEPLKRETHGIVTRAQIDNTSLYPYLTALSRPWCRYCGVTVSSKWKTGPWGSFSLCNSHGPDDEGNEQFDLHRFSSESSARLRPILSDYCMACWSSFGADDKYYTCHGCSLSIHCDCIKRAGTESETGQWYCSPECIADRRKRIVRGKIGFDERMPFTINLTDTSTDDSVPSNPPNICIPKFTRITPVLPRMKRCSKEIEAELASLDEGNCCKRHAKFESIEKNNHLLRPQILKRLFPKKAAAK